MVKIVKDVEMAQHIDQCGSDLPSETDESFKYLLESDSSMPEQTPKVTVWHSSIMWQCYITSGVEGSDWQNVADGNDI